MHAIDLWYRLPVISSVLIGVGVFVGALVVVWILYRVAFPKQSSASARAIAIVISLILWGGDIRHAADTLFLMASYAVNSWSNHVTPGLQPILTYAANIPYFDLLLVLITLGILVRLMSALDQGTSPKWLQNFQKTSLMFRTNLLVLTIFFLGIYLAVASLCTIPSLGVNQPFTEEERTQINAEIDAANPTGDAFEKEFPAEVSLPPDDLAHLRNVLAKFSGERIVPDCEKAPSASGAAEPNTGAAATGTTPKSPESTPALLEAEAKMLQSQHELQQNIGSLLRSFDDERCLQRNQYYSMRESVKRLLRSMADNAKNVLSSNLALRLTGRDRANFLYEQKNKIGNNSNFLQVALGDCRRSLSVTEYGFRSIAEQYERSLDQTQNSPATNLISPVYPTYPVTGAGACSFNPEIFARVEYNYAETAQLGVFSLWFGWLENSDSLALSVLCGMLGVGLVGSVVSSFVRQSQMSPSPAGEQTESKDTALRRLEGRLQSVWIADPFPVVVRGFTAAVVVYLAVEGGLNIFSTASNQPNPYVLLFACLVGAIFSEDVWVIARRNLPAAETGHRQESSSRSKAETQETNRKTDPEQSDPQHTTEG